jgi:hypothetical protein
MSNEPSDPTDRNEPDHERRDKRDEDNPKAKSQRKAPFRSALSH